MQPVGGGPAEPCWIQVALKLIWGNAPCFGLR